jgi:hypothetical protein
MIATVPLSADAHQFNANTVAIDNGKHWRFRCGSLYIMNLGEATNGCVGESVWSLKSGSFGERLAPFGEHLAKRH